MRKSDHIAASESLEPPSDTTRDKSEVELILAG